MAKTPALMCAWRVYGIRDDYLSQRDEAASDWVADLHDSPTKGDQTTFLLGALSAEYQSYVRLARASLYVGFGGGDWTKSDDRLAARDEAIRNRARDIDLSDLTEGIYTWLSIEVRRPVVLTDKTGSEFLWADFDEVRRLAEPFHEEVGPWLDYLTAVALSGLRDVRLERVVASSNRPLFLAEGRGPVFWPEATAGEVSLSVGKPWASLPFDQLNRAVVAVPRAQRQDILLVQSASRWLTAAMRERDDPLRRFLFAFFGLEVLAGKFARANGTQVIRNLESTLNSLPLSELVWPREQDNDFPARNLTFRFTLMAVGLSPDSARDDVASFKVLSRQRNDLAHGADIGFGGLAVRECVELLSRYVALAAEGVTTST